MLMLLGVEIFVYTSNDLCFIVQSAAWLKETMSRRPLGICIRNSRCCKFPSSKQDIGVMPKWAGLAIVVVVTWVV